MSTDSDKCIKRKVEKNLDENNDSESAPSPKIAKVAETELTEATTSRAGPASSATASTGTIIEESQENSTESVTNVTVTVSGESETIDSTDTVCEKQFTSQGTYTEEDYVPDIEKILKDYAENYNNAELEEYKDMLQKFYIQNLRLATRCQKLKAAAEKNQSSVTRILKEASKHVNPYQLALITSQITNNNKVEAKRVWSPQMKTMMIGLYKVSPNAYKYLSQILLLPDEESVAHWIDQGAESELLKEDMLNDSESPMAIEAQSVLDEITFENLMATLL